MDQKTGKSYEDVENQLEEMFGEQTTSTPVVEKKAKEVSSSTNATPPQTQKPQNKVKRKRPKPKPKGGFREKEKLAPAPPKVEKAKATTAANENTTYRQIGPYVLIKGTKQVVVNCPSNEDESERVTKRIHSHNTVRGMSTSTLSLKYDAETTDQSWLCIFCKKGPHRNGMGDLFGPFLIPTSLDAPLTMKSPKRKLSDASKQKSLEAWTHESCAISAPNVYLIGTKVVGLEVAMLESKNYICTVCNENGATLGCLTRGCGEKAHILCAKQNNWCVPKDFRYFCANHNNKAIV